MLTGADRNLIGFAASTDPRLRSYFVVEVVRCAFSYGCYQMEVFQGWSNPFPFLLYRHSCLSSEVAVADLLHSAVLKNFLHLRNAIAGRKMALASFVAGERLGLF